MYDNGQFLGYHFLQYIFRYFRESISNVIFVIKWHIFAGSFLNIQCNDWVTHSNFLNFLEKPMRTSQILTDFRGVKIFWGRLNTMLSFHYLGVVNKRNKLRFKSKQKFLKHWSWELSINTLIRFRPSRTRRQFCQIR